MNLGISCFHGLKGLKENVLMGRLIPAGTGMARYRNIKIKVEQEEALREMAEAEGGLGHSPLAGRAGV